MADFVWFKRKTWRDLWVALRRSKRDRHARSRLFRLVLSFVLFVVWLAYVGAMIFGYLHSFGRGGYIIAGVFLAYILFLTCYPYVSDRLERRAIERASPAVSTEMKIALFKEACLFATLLERLASETAMEKEIPPEIEIITRRVLLDRLATIGLRDDLDPWLLDLLLAPDGHWTREQKQRAASAWECLYVFRWALGLGELPELTRNPRYSFADTSSFFDVKEPTKLSVLPSWDIRPARNASLNYLNRCWAELLGRRVIKSAPEEDVEHALGVCAVIQEADYTGDYLIGDRTIVEIDTPQLFFVARRAYQRWQTLTALVDVLSGDAPLGSLRKFMAHYFAPVDDSELGTSKSSENPDTLSEAATSKDI